MARFNLDDYETVEQRIARFYKDQPDGRIVTCDCTNDADREKRTWRMQASIFMSGEEQERGLVKATGYAFEIDGTQGANQTAAMENAETSAIGRALANAGYSGNKRTTREEMQKVERGIGPANAPAPSVTAAIPDGLIESIADCTEVAQLKELWESAGAGGYLTDDVKAAITKRKAALS